MQGIVSARAVILHCSQGLPLKSQPHRLSAGGAVLLAAMGLVGLATAGVLGLGSGETLATVRPHS